jgi:hypothetical protein
MVVVHLTLVAEVRQKTTASHPSSLLIPRDKRVIDFALAP